jgi:DNA-binding NarL/FixJ family response regulator
VSDETRILLVEDHQMVGAAFRSVLAAVDGFDVVGTATTLGEAADMVGYLRPDVAVVDYRLPDGEVADHLPRLRASHPSMRVLVVTGWASARTVARSREAGADGLVSKSEPVEVFLGAVRRVAAGEQAFPPEAAIVHSWDAPDATGQLTRREVEVLGLLSQGWRTSEIAQHLHLSVNTVRNHMTAILAKLGVHTRLEAVTEAMRLGIISAPENSG